MEKFCYYFLLYFMYCVFGYILECIYCSIVDKKIVDILKQTPDRKYYINFINGETKYNVRNKISVIK